MLSQVKHKALSKLQPLNNTFKNGNKEGALGVSIWWRWSSIIISSVIFVWSPITRITISRITSTSKMAWWNIRWRVTAASTSISSWTISITGWSWWISVIITEHRFWIFWTLIWTLFSYGILFIAYLRLSFMCILRSRSRSLSRWYPLDIRP